MSIELLDKPTEKDLPLIQLVADRIMDVMNNYHLEVKPERFVLLFRKALSDFDDAGNYIWDELKPTKLDD